MIEWIYRKSHRHFITVMMLATRFIGSIGGGFVLLYVLLSTNMPIEVQDRFLRFGVVLIALAVAVTVPIAWAHTRRLRLVLGMLDDGEPVPSQLLKTATYEAVRFPLRQNIFEALIVPSVSTIPMCLDMAFRFSVTNDFLLQIGLASFLGIALVLLVTFFASEQWMSVVISDLIKQGGGINFDELPKVRIQSRIMICFVIIIMITGVLIGASVHQETFDMTRMSSIRDAVHEIRTAAVVVTCGAILVGCLYSHWLAQSITRRLHRLVAIMQLVEAGHLSVRATPTGNDELDLLARRFNDMIAKLDRETTIARELNANLEQKVEARTIELSQTLQQVQDLDRLKTEFFSNVSHELRTPLTMIFSPIQQLQENFTTFSPHRIANLLNVVHLNSHRLLKQINQLLEFSKLKAGKSTLVASEVQLNDIVQRLVQSAGTTAEQRGIELRAELAPRLPMTCSDENKLDVAVMNLISNAIKFTPYGGQILVKTEAFDKPEGTLLRFSVTDTGPGVSIEDQARLFQRFVQLDGSMSRAYSGTGLGLALVREFVELLGGRVGIDSVLGRGSTFWFEIPWQAMTDEAPAIESPSREMLQMAFADLKDCRLRSEDYETPVIDIHAPTILVAEDNPEIRDLLVELLCDEYHIITAEDGLDALTKLERITPDLIISDIMMPRMDGQSLCREVKSRRETAAVPFMLLTARSATSMKIEGLDCGADDYICKPFDDAELQARVRAMLRVRSMHVQLDKRRAELEETNQHLRQAQQQLVHSEKLSSLGQLVAGLAHEINNSINAVYNGVPALKLRLGKLRKTVVVDDSSASGIKLREAFDKLDLLADVIESGADRTARIVSDMKTFAHPGRERNEDFDVHRALDLCLNLSTKQTALPVHIERDYCELPVIHGPFGQLHQVFLNIFTNAVQAMAEGGTITVSTARDKQAIAISLRDTGPGILKENRDKIFEPFYTTKAPGVGTGLGLSISYSIVHKLGGKIECHSEVGHGTEFVIRVPLPRMVIEQEAARAISVLN